MGNKQQQRQENWEANERGGDYRIKYRSWRQGEPESGPFNTPLSSKAPQKEIVPKSLPKSAVSDDSLAVLDSSHFDDWIPNPINNAPGSRSTSIPTRALPPLAPKRRSSSETILFPPEVNDKKSMNRVQSVNEMILDELARAVADELVGPEYTPIAKSPNPTSIEEDLTSPTKTVGINGKGESIKAEQNSDEEHRLKMVVNHLYGPVLEKVKMHLKSLPDWYTAKTQPQEVAGHIRILLEARRYGVNKVAVSVFPQYDESHRPVFGYYVVVVCAKDRRQLLDAITRCVSTRASISEATIVTTGDGFALDRFVLSLRSDELDKSLFDDLSHFGEALKQDIEDVLATTTESPSLTPMQSASASSSKRSSKRKTINVPPLPENSEYTAKFEVPFQEIRLMKVLGEGRTGKTHLAEWNGLRVAAKVMSVDENPESQNKKFKSNLDEFRRELHLVSKLSHPNIVKFIGASARPPRYMILFELCEGGDVGAMIRQKDRKYSFFQVAIDAANGLAFLHRNDIIHRDIKPENLMLDKVGRVKVADFGLSCYASGAAAEFTAETGTYRYMAPEVMRHELYSFPADVYSFALVCYVLLSRRLPFDDCTPLQAAMSVARSDSRPKLPANLPKNIADLIQQCWNKDPARRLDFEQVTQLLTQFREELNNRAKKVWDYGFHKGSSFSSTTSLTASAI